MRLVPGPHQDPAIVQMLETLTDEARKGSLRGIAGISLWQGDMSSQFWSLGPGSSFIRLLGDLDALKFRLAMRSDPDLRDEARSTFYD